MLSSLALLLLWEPSTLTFGENKNRCNVSIVDHDGNGEYGNYAKNEGQKLIVIVFVKLILIYFHYIQILIYLNNNNLDFYNGYMYFKIENLGVRQWTINKNECSRIYKWSLCEKFGRRHKLMWSS